MPTTQHYRTVEEIRQARLLELLEQSESLSSLAKKIGKSPAQVSQWKNKNRRSEGGHANMESASARHIERKLGKPTGWMDHDPGFDFRHHKAPAGMSELALDIARWFDGLADPATKDRAYVIISQMLVSGRWPTMTAPAPEPTEAPRPAR